MPNIGGIEFLLLVALFLMAACVTLILLAAVTLRGAVGSPRRRANGPRPTAEATLNRRYASGEMTREEYLTTRDDITGNSNA